MFTFRYIGHFNLDEPIIKMSDYQPAVPNVLRPIPRAVFDDLVARFPVNPGSVKWYYGALMSFLSRPGEYHAFERALIEEEKCSALNLRLDVICKPGKIAAPLVDEVWAEEDYLDGPSKGEMHWCEAFYQRLVSPENPDERPAPTLQGQLLRAATMLWYEMANGGQFWDEWGPEIFLAYEEFVIARLCDGTFNDRAREVTLRAVAGLNQSMNRHECDNQVMNDLLAMELLAYHWCRLHPDPLPPAAVMWEQ